MTENDLCEAFIRAADLEGWTAYPETASWDVLLVRRGIQVGVQAKLQACNEVLLQAMPNMGTYLSPMRKRAMVRGPHYRMVLIGGWKGRTDDARKNNQRVFAEIAQHLHLLVARQPENEWQTWLGGSWPVLNLTTVYSSGNTRAPIWWRWYRWPTTKPETLPLVVPKVAAGVPSPETVSPWSVAAILLERRCDERGSITIADAREIRDQCNGRWNPSTMLSRYFIHDPPPKGKWIFHPKWPRPSKRHPGTARSLTEANL